MPLSLNPNATVPVSLDSDKQLPEPRPEFLCRFLTCAQQADMLGKLDDAFCERDMIARRPKLREALLVSVTGWRNMGDRSSDPQNIDALLTEDEMFELGYAALTAIRLAEQDKKKSASQSKSPSASDAQAAPTPDGA